MSACHSNYGAALQFISGPVDPNSLEALSARSQEIVARTEEMIRESNWAIARSRTLAERLATKRPL